MGQRVQPEGGGHVGDRVRCPKRGWCRAGSPQPRSPRGDRPRPALQGGQGGPARCQNLPPPPSSVFPAQLPGGGRSARGSRPAGGVPEVALGTSRAKGLRPDPGGQPRSLAVTLRVGGGEMVFKGPGRWPHVQEPGPGSRRRRSSSGSAPPTAGWKLGSLSPARGTIVGANRGALCHRMLHRLRGDSSAPVICVPSTGHGHPNPSPTRRGRVGSAKRGCPSAPPEMSPQRQATPSRAPHRRAADHECHQRVPRLGTLVRATVKPGRGCLWHRGTPYNTSVCLSRCRHFPPRVPARTGCTRPEPHPCAGGANKLRACPAQLRGANIPVSRTIPCPCVRAPAHATHAVPRVPAGTVTVPLPPVPARTAWHGPSRGMVTHGGDSEAQQGVRACGRCFWGVRLPGTQGSCS